MKTLYLRIWFTVVAALALFALASGWLVQRHLEQERIRAEAELAERMAGLAEMIQNSLPAASAGAGAQAEALLGWSARLRMPLALDDATGRRIATSDGFPREPAFPDGPGRRVPAAIRLDDGRTLWVVRPRRFGGPLDLDGGPRGFDPGPPHEHGPPPDPPPEPPPRHATDSGPPKAPASAAPEPRGKLSGVPAAVRPWGILALPFVPKDWPASLGLVLLLALLFVAVAAGAYPVVRHLTRRLELLKRSVEAFGAGELAQRVRVDGRDEVASLAASFNQAAGRIEALVRSNQSLLANASHELRSPLARLKMAVAMWADASPAMQARLHQEIDTNIRELDALVDEVLLSSRLEAGAVMAMDEPVDLLGLAAEEAAHVGAEVSGEALVVSGNERLLRRALRNLLENARRYGGSHIEVDVGGAVEAGPAGPLAPGAVRLRVCDRGAGVPEAERERIFEPFYRMGGHAEHEGGVGLGLALVRQIAKRHGGDARCLAREGGGSCFEIRLPAGLLMP